MVSALSIPKNTCPLYQAIAQDKEYRLTNCALHALAAATGHPIEPAHYDLAYRIDHPYIYPIASTAVTVAEYTLNFLWVNLNPQNRQQDSAEHIFGDGVGSANSADFTRRLAAWSAVHPSAHINLWYDSALVTHRAQQNTFAAMQELSRAHLVAIALCDIRHLPNITPEIGHSLHPGTQVYYRVDILKALIADHLLSTATAKYTIISDIDVEPMPPTQLFDERTLHHLTTSGYVFSRTGNLIKLENSFYIFNKENPDLQPMHRKTILDVMERRIAEHRNWLIDDGPDGFHAQCVFFLYVDFTLAMQEPADELRKPRKVVKCPKSQFNVCGRIPKHMFQAETFRFLGASNVPYTTYGRNPHRYREIQLPTLIDWKAEPLPPLTLPVQCKSPDVLRGPVVGAPPPQHAVELV